MSGAGEGRIPPEELERSLRSILGRLDAALRLCDELQAGQRAVHARLADLERAVGIGWTKEGLTSEQIAGGMWRRRWTDEDGVAHDVVAIPVVEWPAGGGAGSGETPPRGAPGG
jgi:hypothetical protein